jgi:hypothetical protein
MLKPAIKGLKTGKTHIFPSTIGKSDLVAKSGAPNFVIFTRRGGVFLHLVGFQE